MRKAPARLSARREHGLRFRQPATVSARFSCAVHVRAQEAAGIRTATSSLLPMAPRRDLADVAVSSLFFFFDLFSASGGANQRVERDVIVPQLPCPRCFQLALLERGHSQQVLHLHVPMCDACVDMHVSPAEVSVGRFTFVHLSSQRKAGEDEFCSFEFRSNRTISGGFAGRNWLPSRTFTILGKGGSLEGLLIQFSPFLGPFY